MRKILIIGAVSTAILSFNALADVGIASGQPSGTNYPMVQDIVRVCSTPSQKINNVVSEGSLDSLQKIYTDHNTQYGIIQADALVYQQGLDKKMMDRIMMVFPFFSTEIHVVVRADSPIKTFNDLAGKIVIEGPDGSGTWVTAQVMKSLTGVNWRGFNASIPAGLAKVQQGQADAEIIVAGKPIAALKDAKNVRLLSINNPRLDSFNLYTKTMISSGSYSFQPSPVQTYKVDNVLATYAYKTQFQKEIGSLVTCIAKNVGNLQQTGHPKWRDVDPTDINRIKWPAHPAAAAAINKVAK